MNLLEQYIVEIHSVEPYEAEWTKRFPKVKFVEADVTTNCYGRKDRQRHVFNTEEWEKFKEQGYWMA